MSGSKVTGKIVNRNAELALEKNTPKGKQMNGEVRGRTEDIKAINFYGIEKVDATKITRCIEAAVSSLASMSVATDVKPAHFVKHIFEDIHVAELLVLLSRLPVFDKEFSLAMASDLDTLAIAKKLKYYTNLPVGQNLLLIQQLLQRFEKLPSGYDSALIRLVEKAPCLSNMRFKDYVKEKRALKNNKVYEENNETLETIDPHSVYPTSIYRHCDGLTLATQDSQTIEAVMSTTLTTTIKITRKVLDPSNEILADVYKPFGRCVAIVDDKVVVHYGKELDAYFAHFGIELVKLVHGGNEIDKDMQNVEQILIELKKNAVSRNEPVLIMGGGVLADIGGFATALYHRNTPYVMLCTSIVTGIDAGPSPRTCCDGHGFKNLYGAYHPPVLTLTDRSFWRTLHEGWIRAGIAEIIKMAVVKDLSLFELLEKAGPRLIRTKFGTVGDTDPEFEELCDLIVGKAMEGYVRSEYGNLWETHQCRPHAYGHTWSPGYELPAGMLHGHAVATCMGYGAYLARLEDFITQGEMERIHRLLSRMELTMWHDIMDNHDLVNAANVKVIQKRGGNLCAPLPRKIGQCGYLNSLPRQKLDRTLDEYKVICERYPRKGRGIQMHCHDTGLLDPATVAGGAYDGIKKCGESCHDHHKKHDHKKHETAKSQPVGYMEWIKQKQTARNSDWKMNVQFQVQPDTKAPPSFDKFSLFQEGAERYALNQTSLASVNVQIVAKMTQEKQMFAPCMVGTLESQFLKMQAMIKGAKTCLDIGTFTGMSAIALAEGIPSDGKVVTVEFDSAVAAAAQEAFDMSTVGDKIELHVCSAVDLMQRLLAEGMKFDLIFIDANKEDYIKYYDLAMAGLLADDGIMLADNSLCALLYDSDDMRSHRLHDFNQHVKNDDRVEQVVLTVREGITLIRRVNQPDDRSPVSTKRRLSPVRQAVTNGADLNSGSLANKKARIVSKSSKSEASGFVAPKVNNSVGGTKGKSVKTSKDGFDFVKKPAALDMEDDLMLLKKKARSIESRGRSKNSTRKTDPSQGSPMDEGSTVVEVTVEESGQTRTQLVAF